MKLYFLLGYLTCSALITLPSKTRAQPAQSYWIFLNERAPLAGRTPADLGITARALQRRSKVLPPNSLIDDRDVPPSPATLRDLELAGIRIRSISRWFNAVSVEAREEQLRVLRSLASVRRIEPVRSSRRPEPLVSSLLPGSSLSKAPNQTTLEYGPSIYQVSNIRVVDVHNLGIFGSGVIVGMNDDGFNNHRTHEALRNIRILAEYDFINRDSVTSAQIGESDGGGTHGEYTLSALAGYSPKMLIGPAFGATLMLGKTEVGAFEQPVEEDYYVEALEWMERTGADVVSTSLGYCDWYVYADMDGQTALTSRAGRVAASKGVLLVTAMGNASTACFTNVNGELTLIAPADADSIVAVGATFSDMLHAPFSVAGPTADGRVKPEVVAQGVSVVSASGPNSAYAAVSGTSLSTPLVAGVAALIFSAHPHLTPMQVREALLNTAVRVNDPPLTSTWPNNYYGWGFVNALEAVLYHGTVFSNLPYVRLNDSVLTVSTFIRSQSPLPGDSLFVYYQESSGSPYQRVLLIPTSTPHLFQAFIPADADTNYPRGYFSARDASGNTRIFPSSNPDSLFAFQSLLNENPPGFSSGVPESYVLYPNYPNPFNAGTKIVFEAPTRDAVELTIYNIIGQKIRTITHSNPNVGSNFLFWDGLNEAGRAVPSGVYFGRLHNRVSPLTIKMLLIR